MIKIISSKYCKAAIAFVTAMCFSFNSFAVSSQIVNSFYNYAHYGQTSQMRQLMKMGYGIDVQDEDGVTAWCIAKDKDDEQALRVLRWMGADPKQKCPACAAGGCMGWPVAGAVAGALVVGGGIAALAGGGGGGGSSPCADKPNSHQENGECVCNDGYLEQEGVCYQDLQCADRTGSTGVQTENACVCKTGYAGNTCESCADGYINQNGVCYRDLNCSSYSGSTGEQSGNQCVCKTGYSGTTCEECAIGYSRNIAGDSTCYADKDCGHGTQVGNECQCSAGYAGDTCNSCADGYIDTGDGVCYPDLNCSSYSGSTGAQNGNQCVCKTGYTGTTCSSCASGYTEFEGACYPSTDCNGHGTQDRDTCICDTGYTGDTCESCANGYINQTGVCYPDLNCSSYSGSTGEQNGNQCVCKTGYSGTTCSSCASGYSMFEGVCYPNTECGAHGRQDRDTCVCDTGYTGDTCDTCDTGYIEIGGACYQDLHCSDYTPASTGVQTGNSCECNEGYTGTTCQSCATGYSRNIAGDNTCYADKDCGHGTQVGNECQCSAGYILGSGPKYCSECDTANGYGLNGAGECVVKAQDVLGRVGNINWNSGQITLIESGYADLYGLKYDAEAGATTTLGYPDSLYNSYAVPSNGVFSQENSIKITKSGDGNVYGLYSDNAASIYNLYIHQENTDVVTANVTAAIDITQKGNGNVYGIYGKNNLYNAWLDGGIDPASNYDISSTITINNSGTGDSYGMYSESGAVDNNGAYNSSISVTNTSTKGGMKTVGIRSAGTDEHMSISNSGEITVSAKSGKVYGIVSEGGGNVDNSGTITVKGSNNTDLAVGIYAVGGEVINTDTGVIDVTGATGKTFGIIATNGATVTNEGTIKINGTSCTNCTTEQNSPYIVLDDTSMLSNSSQFISSSDLDFNKIGGVVMLAKGGTFEADGKISGNLAVDAAGIASEGFEDRYVAQNALKADDIDVNLRSNSAMFTAEQNGNDVVMNRVAFNNLSADGSIASFLEHNYANGNGAALFNDLRRSPSQNAFGNTESSWLGYGLLPNFSRENMRFMQNLNSVLNDKLFETAATGSVRKMVGYDYFTQDRDTRGTLTGYDNYANSAYFMYDREVNADWRAGFGMSVTHFYSSYDDDSSRKEIMVQALLPVSYDSGSRIKTSSIFRAGYGNGEYKRHAANTTFESDLSEWIYGLSNSARYEIDLDVVKLEPVAEFNILGYYQNRIREDKGKEGAINADAENNLSVEAGIGVRLSKDFELDEHNKIALKAGAMYYHEFANPYHSLTASQHGMSGTYRITDYEGIYERDRGVINAGVDYDWNEFTFYADFNQYIEDENPFAVNLGLKYNF